VISGIFSDPIKKIHHRGTESTEDLIFILPGDTGRIESLEAIASNDCQTLDQD
jgi:hypothetical protein